MSTINTAAREYASRPADERFPSVQAMVQMAMQEQERSKEVVYHLSDLRVEADQNKVRLATSKGQADFSNWSFGQFSRMVGAPADYLRTLDPSIAKDALNYSLRGETQRRLKEMGKEGDKVSILVKAPNGNPNPVVRAITTDSYTRVWDSEVFGPVVSLMQQDAKWTTPPTWSGESAGAYRGDRDAFVIVVNGGSIVTDPSAGQDGQMYRGILLRNSEVGAASISIDTILFRYICGNHMLWGASMESSYRRRHIGSTVGKDTFRYIAKLAREHANHSAEQDEALIKGLIARKMAEDEEDLVDELKKLNLSKKDSLRAIDLCKKNEKANPLSFWGVAQGITRASQESGYEDTRYIMDAIAAKVLAKGRQLVMA